MLNTAQLLGLNLSRVARAKGEAAQIAPARDSIGRGAVPIEVRPSCCVGRTGLMTGNLLPYDVVGFVEILIVLVVMIYLFGVPINGSIPLLLVSWTLFMVCSLGLGLLVSTLARTQLEAVPFASVIKLSSVLLFRFVFPRSELPFPIYILTFAIPATYFIEILRGIVLHGADFFDLIGPVIGLVICGTIVIAMSVFRFRQQVA